MTESSPRGSLDGIRVAITADRRGAEFASSLKRLGAEVTWGSTMTALPPETDSLIEIETRAMLAARPTWLAVSTGSGLRAWLQAAESFGLRDDIEHLLSSTRTVARGSKSHGALRGLRIEPEFVSPQETMDDICSWLSERVCSDHVLAAQVHGGEVIGTLDALRPRVRDVLTVAPYRWVLPADLAPARRVVDRLLAGEIDVLAETSAPSVRNLLLVAAGMGAQSELLRALRGPIRVACVGPVTARAFEEVGVPIDLMPKRSRTADLIRSIVHWAATRDMPLAGTPAIVTEDFEIPRGLELVPGATAVRIGPQVIRLGRQEFSVLAALVRRPGVVIRPEDLALQAWGHRAPNDSTRVRHHVARIRRKLGDRSEVLQTVRNVGYRYQPPSDSDA